MDGQLEAGGGEVLSGLDTVTLATVLERFASMTAQDRFLVRRRVSRVFDVWRSGQTSLNVLGELLSIASGSTP